MKIAIHCALAVFALSSLSGFAASNDPEVPARTALTCEEEFLALDQSLRTTTISCMRTAAALAGKTISTDDIVTASRKDVFLANTAIANVNTLPIEQFYVGADIMFLYLNPKDGHEMELPPGFYTARLTVDPETKQGTMDFLDENDRVAFRSTEVDIYRDEPERGIDVKVTGSIRPRKVTVDIRITFGSSDVTGPTYEVAVSIHDRA